MSDKPAEDTTEMDSYEITATRRFEIDLSGQQVAGMMQQTGADNPEQAIEQVLLGRERQQVEPEEKLIGVQVQADEPSDD